MSVVKRNIRKMMAVVVSVLLLSVAMGTSAKAAPISTLPQVSYLPMWYYMQNGTTDPSVHKFFNTRMVTMPGKTYIDTFGLNTYASKDTFNLEQALIDNPDLVAAGLITRDAVWNFFVAFDSISPRVFHSLNPDEEVYCTLRNVCIGLGTYPSELNTLSVAEKARRIDEYMCQNYNYDYSYSVASFQEMMYSGVGICNAYTGLFDALASISGIMDGTIEGPNHIWNAIQAEDGQWYEIDVTWNDCLSDKSYFMVKDHYNANPWVSNRLAGNSMDWWITEDLY